MAQAVEFRGCDNLVIAEVLTDDLDTYYSTGTVKTLAPVAEISKTVDNSSETHFYDNVGMIVIRGEGSDNITLTVPALDLKTVAWLTGKTLDEATGAFIDTESVERYFAIGYRLRLTDGSYRYVWRLKGAFNIPDETSATENEGTDTNNQQLTFTGNKTVTRFNYDGKRAKGIVIDERDDLCNLETFFDTVQTPDTISDLAKSTTTAISVSPTTASLLVDGTQQLTPTTTPSGQPVRYATSNAAVATVSSTGLITAKEVGTAIITAVSGYYSASCTVTVTEE